MVYRMIDELEKKCGRLSGAALSHRDTITLTLAQRWAHKLPDGQTVPDVFQLQTFISEDLDELHQEVLRVEGELRSELTEDREKREVRDRARNAVREHLFGARKIFDAIYGPGGSDAMFEEPSSYVRTDPVPLYRQGTALHDNLLDPEFNRPPVRLDVGVDLTMLAQKMKPDLDVLGTAIRQLRKDTQDSNELFAAKDREMDRLDRRIGVSARLLESLYHYADHPGIAVRVRPSTHRSGRGGGSAPPAALPEGPTPLPDANQPAAPGEDGTGADDASPGEPEETPPEPPPTGAVPPPEPPPTGAEPPPVPPAT
ncbi:MAG: hypothetical protein GY719_41930 [bacterium]|nr:hypothetical protein [bacterium]